MRLLDVNEGWVAAFLAGANHVWAREALWNEYPADLGATAFSTFWPRVPVGTTDLARDMHEWPHGAVAGEQVGAGRSSTVLVVRGEVDPPLPRHRVLLVAPGADGALRRTPTATCLPGGPPGRRSPATSIPDGARRVRRRPADGVRDEGRYVAIQEPSTGPRFGLDHADASRLRRGAVGVG